MKRVFAIATTVVAICTGCSTVPESAPPQTGEQSQQIRPRFDEEFTVVLNEQPLGLAVRQLAKDTGTNLVLMNGLENYPLDAISLQNTTVPQVLQQISEQTGCKIQDDGTYFFLYAPDYEALTKLDLSAALPEPWRSMRATASFGADTPLFNAFALLGQSLETAIVGDNAISDSESGELHFDNILLPDALEAILKAARVQRFGFRIRATDDYLFVHTPGNQLRKELIAQIHPEATVDMTKTCDIRLLFTENEDGIMEGQLSSSRLKQILPRLSTQLGLPIEAEPAMHKLPVNPVMVSGVTREIALELIIRQWLLPEFGYDITKDGIRLRYLGPEL